MQQRIQQQFNNGCGKDMVHEADDSEYCSNIPIMVMLITGTRVLE